MYPPGDVWKCRWIQEMTGKVWFGLKKDIIDTAVNGRKKHFRACVRVMGRHFKHFYCRQCKMYRWINCQKNDKNVDKTCLVFLWLSNNTLLDRNAIFPWFCFPHAVQKQILGDMKVEWVTDRPGQLRQKYSCQKLLKYANVLSSYSQTRL